MKRILSKNNQKELFLILVAPIHFWAILIFFWNLPISSVHFWTALGLMSYDVVIAFFDSLILFFSLVLIGIFLPIRWSGETKLLFLSNFGFTLLLGLIFGQYLDSSSLKSGQMWTIVGVISLMLLAFFEYFSLTKKKIKAVHLGFFNRIKTLSYIFLGLDVFGLLIILIRNIFWVRLT